jgi:hypothetical protein
MLEGIFSCLTGRAGAFDSAKAATACLSDFKGVAELMLFVRFIVVSVVVMMFSIFAIISWFFFCKSAI